MSEYHFLEFGFRFTRLTTEIQHRLRATLSCFEIESRDPTIAYIGIGKDQDLQPLYSFLEQENIEPAACSIWISFTTTREIDGFALPQYILDLIRMTKSGVEFSIMALGPEDDTIADGSDTVETMGEPFH
jgi:hypothetical protein